jgi:hypothetical protein
MKKQWFVALLAVILVAGFGVPAQAQTKDDWKFEVAPYLWGVGIDGSLTAEDGREAEFEYSLDDLMDRMDVTMELLATAQYKQFVGFTQIDYIRLSEDEFKQPAAQEKLEKVTLDSSFVTLAGGYQFPTIKDSWVDVLLGARIMFMGVEVEARDGWSRDESHTITDAILVLRPNFRITDKLRFNPTLSVGAGDSDLVYELQPQFEYNFTKLIGVRIGYRTLGYKYTTDRETEIDVNFSGPMLGVSFNF